MKERFQLVIIETSSLPRGYKALDDVTRLGLEALEFYPHANGVRLMFKADESFNKRLPSEAISISVSTQILKALLSQTNQALQKFLIVVETKKLSDLVRIATHLEKAEAKVLEIRSMRSNNERNYALFSHDNDQAVSEVLINTDHVILKVEDSVLKEFLGFA